MEGSRNIAPVKLEMLMAVVHNSKLAYYCSVIQSHQANMQFTVAAKGTTHLILNYLGLSADREFDLHPGSIRLQVQVLNLLDVQYEVVRSYPMMGRNYRLKITYIF